VLDWNLGERAVQCRIQYQQFQTRSCYTYVRRGIQA